MAVYIYSDSRVKGTCHVVMTSAIRDRVIMGDMTKYT